LGASCQISETQEVAFSADQGAINLLKPARDLCESIGAIDAVGESTNIRLVERRRRRKRRGAQEGQNRY